MTDQHEWKESEESHPNKIHVKVHCNTLNSYSAKLSSRDFNEFLQGRPMDCSLSESPTHFDRLKHMIASWWAFLPSLAILQTSKTFFSESIQGKSAPPTGGHVFQQIMKESDSHHISQGHLPYHTILGKLHS